MIACVSFLCMAYYLYKNGVIKHVLFGLRPDVVFVEYYKNTIKEQGRVGRWFWIAIIGFVCFLVVFLFSGLMVLISR
jgi:hypothetical protein